MNPTLLWIPFALAVLLAWLRLALRQRQAPAGGRSRGWRMMALFAAQPALAATLYLTLAPPPRPIAEPGVLTVLTRGGTVVSGPVVALPEASDSAGIERAPDLATVLRRHPGIHRLHIRGEGLEARDRATAQDRVIAFDPPQPLVRGLVDLVPPGRVAPGGVVRVSGRIVGGGSVELLDPGGAKVAAAAPDGDGRFTLETAARVPGLALFTLRSRDTDNAIVSTAQVPVWTAGEPGLRVLLLGGAPGPEIKFWRRWAADAGLAPTVRVAIGAGVGLGDPLPTFSPASLAKVDLLILDERSWASLPGSARAAIAAAVRGGMGVLLRVTGPVPAGYGAGLGMPLAGGTDTASVRLTGRDEPALPPLTRRVVRVGATDTLSLVTDIRGTELAVWRSVGRGRVGAWVVTDAAKLVTTGHGETYGAFWAKMVATLGRPTDTASGPRLAILADRNERTVLCGVAPGDTVMAPDGGAVPVLVDPTTPGCAAYWPRATGWHALRHGATRWPFYVRAAPPAGIAAAARHDATLALVRPDSSSDTARPVPSPGSSWPWLVVFLAIAGLTWWLERAPTGRRPEDIARHAHDSVL